MSENFEARFTNALRIAAGAGIRFEGDAEDAKEILDYFDALQVRITELVADNAELRENADIVKHCGFEIITEEATGRYPARKVLRGVDSTYVPGYQEMTK